jgi:DHA1 family tetracycline resistance protein-like MFS transporter
MDRRRIIPIFFIIFTNMLGSGVIIPVLPLFAEGQFGATAFQASTLVSAFFAAQFIAAPWIGRLSDRIGRRPVLIGSQIGTVASFVIFIFAEPLGARIDALGLNILGMSGGLLVLYLGRILDGLTFGNVTAAQAYITDVTSEEKRAQALGIISAAFGLGFIFGPAFGGLLARYSLVAPFIGAAVICALSVLLTTIMLQESLPLESRGAPHPHSHARMADFLSNSTVFLILAITFIVFLPFAALQSTFTLYADRVLFPEQPAQVVSQNVGWMFTFIGVVIVITQGALIRPLIRRLGEQRLALAGLFSLLLAYVGLSVANGNLWLVIPFFAPIAFGQGVYQPSLQSLITRFGGPRERGRLLGLFTAANSLGLIFGPIWGGWVFERINPAAPYYIAIPLLLLAIGLAMLLRQRPIPTTQTQAAVS